MEILEFGNQKQDKIILIHGFESPYQIWDDYIEYYKKDYCVIVPILTGHNVNENTDFESFEKCVEELEDYYLKKYGNQVFAVYGMSMGGVLASILWQNQNIKIDKLIVESSPLLGYGNMMTRILTKQYLTITHKAQARDEKTVRRAVNSIIPEDKLDVFLEMMDNMSDTTITNYIRQIGSYKLPGDINTSNTEVYYYYGTKINELLAKKTAEYIRKKYPSSKIKCFQGKGHCEDSLLNPSVMIEELDTVLGMKKSHNLSTNYSQIKVDRVKETKGINEEKKKDELER
ncbi:MAG: hypothetical protein EOM50_01205 [Erysipelotrichia bacterium]|nr:hypothetical protein [Erysipelotrichia bacterium]